MGQLSHERPVDTGRWSTLAARLSAMVKPVAPPLSLVFVPPQGVAAVAGFNGELPPPTNRGGGAVSITFRLVCLCAPSIVFKSAVIVGNSIRLASEVESGDALG